MWTVLLFVGSLTSYSGFPDRFERDLGVPLALLAALALVTVLRSLWSSRAGGGTSSWRPLTTALLSAALVGAQAALNLEEAAGPSVRPQGQAGPAGGSPPQASGSRSTTQAASIVATPYLELLPEPLGC
jgi:hypothetical protein